MLKIRASVKVSIMDTVSTMSVVINLNSGIGVWNRCIWCVQKLSQWRTSSNDWRKKKTYFVLKKNCIPYSFLPLLIIKWVRWRTGHNVEVVFVYIVCVLFASRRIYTVSINIWNNRESTPSTDSTGGTCQLLLFNIWYKMKLSTAQLLSTYYYVHTI